MAEAAAAVAAVPAVATVAAVAAAPWYQGVEGVDPEIVGHLTNKGWDKKTPAQAAIEAVKAARAAEKYVGIPTAELLRVPKEASDEQGWNAVWARLGKPAEAKLYDFSGIKYADGTAPEESFIENLRQTAFRLHLTKDAAPEIARQVVKYLETADQTESTEKQAKFISEQALLKTNWGPNETANKFVATRGAALLGLTPEEVHFIETGEFKGIGYARVMESFRALGAKMGEDKYVTGQQGSPGVMTREGAQARIKDLTADKAWFKSYLAGDAEKKREMFSLTSIVTGIPVPPGA